jgi:hypothetical protein
MKTITTTLTHYRFDLADAEQRAAYDAMIAGPVAAVGFPVWTMHADFNSYNARKPVEDFVDKVRALVGRRVNATGMTSGQVTLETEHLFDNQWNGESLRLFNWAECVYSNRNIREGYYLEQTAEMRYVLANTLKCGYCGKMEPAAPSTPAFCPHCIDSEYLKESELNLTRLVPVLDTSKPRAELSDAERDAMLPIYRDAQIHGATERGKARIAKQRDHIEREYESTVAHALEKRNAARWIMAHCPQMLDNWIFYTHTGKHCFGWRTKLSAAEVSAILDVVNEFPYGYTLECADGRKLEAEA